MDETPLSEYDSTIIRNYIASITQRVNEINKDGIISNNENTIEEDLSSPAIVTM